MLPVDSYNHAQIAAIQEACSYLFDREQFFDLTFIRNLDSNIIHRSYLRKKIEIQEIIKGKKVNINP